VNEAEMGEMKRIFRKSKDRCTPQEEAELARLYQKWQEEQRKLQRQATARLRREAKKNHA
jgi:DNA anti-recombination protein RmuC